MRIAIAIIIVLFMTDADAFHINPLNRDSDHVGSPKEGQFLDLISEAVHENITRSARKQYLERCTHVASNEPWCRYEERLSRGKVIQDSLVRGVWWNDDPNQDLYEGRQAIWLGHMIDAERRAKRSSTVIDGRYMMQYRSHYGDLQFLHSMASADNEKSDITKKNIYMWAELSYRVATGEIKKSTKFKDIHIDGMSKYFSRQGHWELRWVLQPKHRLRDTPHDFEEQALGSLLHMIEDSYSAAHVERDHSPTEHCPSGHIKSFHSYTHQDPSRHGQADSWESYANTKYAENAGPVDIAAQIIWFAHNKSDWETEVRPYLEKSVYCFEGIPEPAGAGAY